MVKLLALHESEYAARFFCVWRGTSLKYLSSKEFGFLKRFYGLDNLRLVFVYPGVGEDEV